MKISSILRFTLLIICQLYLFFPASFFSWPGLDGVMHVPGWLDAGPDGLMQALGCTDAGPRIL